MGALRRAIDRTAYKARRAERRAVHALMEDHLASIQATGAGIHDIAERARAALDGKAFEAFQRNEKGRACVPLNDEIPEVRPARRDRP